MATIRALPFGRAGSWFKGNLHTHSTNSDGRKTPAQVCAAYRRRGYHFLAVTDHFHPLFDFPLTDTRPYRTDDFTTLLGAELHAPLGKSTGGRTDLGDIYHLLGIGLPQDFARTPASESPSALAQRARDAGAFVVIAHPAWHDLTISDCTRIDAAHAVEISNTVCELLNGKGESTVHWDLLTNAGRRLLATAADDAHFVPGRYDPFRNWVVVRARRLHPNAILQALHAGMFYSSQGPEIHDVRADRRKRVLHVETSPVKGVHLSSRGSLSVYRNHKRSAIETELEYAWILQGNSPVRLSVTDSRGRKAWTNHFEL